MTALAGGLVGNGFDVEVLCPGQTGVRRLSWTSEEYRMYYGLSAIARLLTRRYDLIHCNIASLSLLPAVRRKLHKAPILETFHGFPQWWLESKALDKLAYVAEYSAVKKIAKSADVKVSVSRFVRSALLEILGIDSSVIYNGIARCSLLEPTREESRQDLRIEGNTTAILFVGRMHPAKDPMTLLKAFEQLVDERRNVKLLVVGSGPLEEPFQARVREMHLERFVRIWDYLPSLHPIFSAADIFCFPSWNEAFGIVLLEAMDHSLPVVVSDSGAAYEVAGSSGITFKTGDPNDLFKKLVSLVDDDALRHKLGQAGPGRLRDHFRLEDMIDSYSRLYEETLRGCRQETSNVR